MRKDVHSRRSLDGSDLSEKTIQFHKYHIMETFNLKSNADLVLFAIKEGLVSLDPIPQKQNPLS